MVAAIHGYIITITIIIITTSTTSTTTDVIITNAHTYIRTYIHTYIHHARTCTHMHAHARALNL